MALLDKPDVSEVWASGGSFVKPSDEKIQQGWVAEVPPFQYENWVQGRQDQFIAHINQRGIPAWDGVTEYEGGGFSYVQGADGIIYRSVASSGPSLIVQNPVNDVNNDYWYRADDPATTVLSETVPQVPEANTVQEALLGLGVSSSEVMQNMAVFDTPGVSNWAVPDGLRVGLRKAYVIVVGGGGGSAAFEELSRGAGGGGSSEGIVDLSGVSSVTITVGEGGYSGNAWIGGTSSFGSLLSATGGNGGRSGPGDFSVGGVGVGGSLNRRGGSGGGPDATPVGVAGYSGEGGASPYSTSAPRSGSGINGVFPGGGSGSGSSESTGANGVVVVRW